MNVQKSLLIVFCLGVFLASSCCCVHAQNLDAERYAPILYFEAQEECYPVDVTYHIKNAYLYEQNNPVPIATTVTEHMLASYTSDTYYLDNQKGTIADDGIIKDYQASLPTLGYTVYTHIDHTNSVIQYWFFYAFNKGELNQHEGDWEMVQIRFSAGVPAEVMYSQHHSGQKATWEQVERDGDHIKVYVARGSHANYLRPYSGKLGFSSDYVGNNGKILRPGTDYMLEELNNQPWLAFGGFWGWIGNTQETTVESSLLGQAGPQGPKFRENGGLWTSSPSWTSKLLPAHDFLFIADWILYNFLLLFTVITLITVLILCYRIYRRHQKYGLGPRKFALLYIDGFNLKSIGNILCIVGLIIAVVGLLLPWYAVSTTISIPGEKPIHLPNLIAVDGIKGIQITLPNQQGPLPLGSFTLPFSIFIGIGIVFMILGTIGIAQSQKLGKKYMLKGTRFLIPGILVLLILVLFGAIVQSLVPDQSQGNTEILDVLRQISAQPFGGTYALSITQSPGSRVELSWGFGMGLYLLCIAGIILIVAGGCELFAKTFFFEQRQPEMTKKQQKQEKKTEEAKP
ncbi:MAG: Vps62-related protein [Candidatus Thermoplasmatota archaeon]